jgi:hypothetical protein
VTKDKHFCFKCEYFIAVHANAQRSRFRINLQNLKANGGILTTPVLVENFPVYIKYDVKMKFFHLRFQVSQPEFKYEV